LYKYEPVIPLTLHQLERAAPDFDAALHETPDIDRYCSGLHWVVPAHRALMPPRHPWLRRCDEGFVILAQGEHPNGWTYLQPLEGMWGLPSPLAGPSPAALAQALREHSRPGYDWDVLLLGGLEEGSATLQAVADVFSGVHAVRVGYPCHRNLCSIEGGVEAYIGRRRRKFRQNLRRAEARCRRAGVTWERADVADPMALYRRIQDVESTSWKGLGGVGIDSGDMHDFYALMVPRLAATGRLRLLFARLDGRDAGYLLGGVSHGIFRGLQFSYRDEVRPLGLGNAAQVEMMRWLEEMSPEVHTYDLGTEMRYKQRWGERTLTTLSLVVTR
jgi:hypothetical protein